MTTTQHTTVNVSLIHPGFYMPQLQRKRRIRMYYPEGYNESSGTRYPVIYMHDGQNLFDEATAFDKEWQIDETLQSPGAQCIVRGIGKRKRENFNTEIFAGRKKNSILALPFIQNDDLL